MSTRFGIHMGNSTISLSILKDEKIEIVASKFGDRTSCAVMAMTNDREYLMGLPAKQGRARNSALTIVNNFQFLNDDQIDEFNETIINSCSAKIIQTPKLHYKLVKDDDTIHITPYEVAVKLLKNCYENASQAAKLDDDLEAVISVPLNFTKSGRKMISKAAEESGFDILQMISDPSAALLAYEIGLDVTEKSNVLIYRLGGLTCDIYLFRVVNGLYECVAHSNKSNLGGNQLTTVLCDYIANEFYNKHKLNPKESHRTMAKLWLNAENCKHILSTMPSSHVFIESLMDGVDWSQNISRARFENIIASQLSLFIRPVEELLTKYSDIKIDKILFCGGSMKIPKLQSAISSLFPNVTILNSIPPDEVISIGCAKQASYINEAWDTDGEHLDMDMPIINDAIYVESIENKLEKLCLFEKQTIVPVSTKFTVTSDNNGKIILNVTQQNDTHADQIEHVCPLPNTEYDLRVKITNCSSETKLPTMNIVFPIEKLVK